jgi:quercetin dioxygenase-like cupin family protein
MNTTSVRPEPLIQLGGSTITEHLGGEQTNGAVALMEFTIEPGFPVPPPHAHTQEDETTFVIEGALEITIGDETRTVDAGESIFKPRGVPHASAIAGEQRVRFLETITPAGFERYFRALAAIVRDTGMVDRATADRLMAKYGLRTP